MINGFAPKVLVINNTLPCQVHFVYLPCARDRTLELAFEDFQLLCFDATGDSFYLCARREVYSCENTSLPLDNLQPLVCVCVFICNSDKKISSVMKSE